MHAQAVSTNASTHHFIVSSSSKRKVSRRDVDGSVARRGGRGVYGRGDLRRLASSSASSSSASSASASSVGATQDDEAEDDGSQRRSKVVGPSPSEVAGGSLFCFGLGYTALGLARTLTRAGWRVSGTCRSEDRAASFAASGVDAHVWRPDDGVGLSPDGMRALTSATHVLSSVPPVGDFDRDPVLADAECADALIAAAASSGRFPAPPPPEAEATASSPASLRWVGYLSSTAVYGDRGGDWVDERALPSPASPKAVARYAAEEAWRRMFDRHGVPVAVFRLGGIYGPGRSILDAVAAAAASRAAASGAEKSAPAAPADAPAAGPESLSQRARGSRKFTSRCHVGDVVAVLCASIAQSAAAEAAAGRVHTHTVSMVSAAAAAAAAAAEEKEKEEGDDGGDVASPYSSSDAAAAPSAASPAPPIPSKPYGYVPSPPPPPPPTPTPPHAPPPTPPPMRVYNVVDDEPAPRADAAAYARRLLHLDLGEEGDRDAAGGGSERGGGGGGGGGGGRGGGGGAECARGEKRVRNDRIKDELGVRLMYPSYREGLTAIADGDKTPFE